MKFIKSAKAVISSFAFLSLIGGYVITAHAHHRSCSVEAYNFFWSGQIAGFMVNGRFSFNGNAIPENGIIREGDLLSLDVSFYDPKGRLLRTYKDNQRKPVDSSGNPYLNFAFDTITRTLLQDGTWKVDDDGRYRNGFMMGEGNPDLRNVPNSQTGLAFWSRPADDKVPHLHVDDWADQLIDPDTGLPYPTAFSSHEDVAFIYETTQQLLDKPGKVKIDPVATDVGAFGEKVRVMKADRSYKDRRDYIRCLRANTRY